MTTVVDSPEFRFPVELLWAAQIQSFDDLLDGFAMIQVMLEQIIGEVYEREYDLQESSPAIFEVLL